MSSVPKLSMRPGTPAGPQPFMDRLVSAVSSGVLSRRDFQYTADRTHLAPGRPWSAPPTRDEALRRQAAAGKPPATAPDRSRAREVLGPGKVWVDHRGRLFDGQGPAAGSGYTPRAPAHKYDMREGSVALWKRVNPGALVRKHDRSTNQESLIHDKHIAESAKDPELGWKHHLKKNDFTQWIAEKAKHREQVVAVSVSHKAATGRVN